MGPHGNTAWIVSVTELKLRQRPPQGYERRPIYPSFTLGNASPCIGEAPKPLPYPSRLRTDSLVQRVVIFAGLALVISTNRAGSSETIESACGRITFNSVKQCRPNSVREVNQLPAALLARSSRKVGTLG